ncbi:unnamed protein product [Mytilus coruscus]|uniref:Reverse transcriptase domain-containing protein n=1 Tax=Mytilus coruscus TaxID=42192 RepID=A0A6J8A7N4_MYTCO|nr:unnamed protein product [Mytilus coruscus]
MSTADENNQTQSNEISQNLCLKETLVRIKREINTLKGDYTQEIEYLNKTVSVLVRENKELVNANQKNNDRLQNFQNQISSLRENNENLAKTVNNMSVVSYEAEITCKSNKLAIEKSLGTFRNKLDEYENSIQQLTTDVNKIKNDFKTVKLDVNELRSSVKSESCRINQLSDTRAQGVVSLKTKTNLMSDKLKEFDDVLNKVNIDCCSHAKSISDLRKRIINTEKDVKVLDKSTKSYADILKSKSEQVIASAETFDNSNVTESDLSQSTEPIQRNSINEHSHFQLSNTLVDSQTKHVRSSDVTNLSVYTSTTQPNEAFVNELEYLMDTYKSYSNHGTVYILGDFNCKIGGPRYSFTQNRRSQLLESLLIDNNSISLHVQDFAKGPVCTFQSYEDGPKTGIDHIVTNNENTRDIYPDEISQFLWSVQMPSLPATKEDIDVYFKTIIVAVHKADKETLPHKQFVKHIKPYWTKVVDLSHKTMLNKRSLWILNGKVHDRSDQFFVDYKHAKRTFKNEMDKAYIEHIMNIANRMEESIDNDQRYIWSVLKSRRKQKTFYRELNLNGITHTNESEICEAWADHFESIFQFDSKLTNSTNINFVNHEVNKIMQAQKETKAPIIPFEFEEIFNICKNLCNNKSTGLDNVSYKHVKYGGKILQKHLCNLFNLIIRTRYTPLDWKTSVIIPLFKGGNKNKTDPNAYRGISLTSCIAKIFEKSLYPRFDSLHIKFPHQSQMAYQKKLSSVHASFNLQEPIRHYIERNGDVIVVLLDSTKAFDTVWHDALLYKLHKYGVTDDLWLLIDEIYSDMRSSVLFNGDIEDFKWGCVLLDISVSSSVQADDIALLSTTEKGMQHLISICQTYSESWAFKFSPTKSNVLHYSKKNKSVSINLTLYDDIIPLVMSAKHVGILLNCKFRSMDQTLNACRVLRATALSVLNSGIHPSILNPLTYSKIILQKYVTAKLFMVVSYGTI